MRRLALLATVAVVAVSGCGSDGGSADATSAAANSASTSAGSTAGSTTGSDEVDPSMGRQGVGGMCANQAMMPDGGIYTAALAPYDVDDYDKGWIKDGQTGALLTMSLRASSNTLATADSSEFRLLVGDDEIEAERIGDDSNAWDSRRNGIGFRSDDTAAAGETVRGTFIFRPSKDALADKTAVVVLGGGERICAKVS
ncbi:hypothetical protein [Knoellia subterranea]|uniref:DUF4352 domain-containing protein n=1 Tax=Knoellia subterranea KCTC 19937 TaxID=1385521 RepID=A0A0A0JIN8_9MICO|nr:hypothetical protein [Knoellia subterranea]KGN37280.1 hypothetical protein N803_14565 [Knoellia subterranea KCTC 19937]